MPKLIARPSIHALGKDASEEASIVRFEGFVDAANYRAFERSLERAHESGLRFLILDFEDVHYINSTGISVLIRYYELYRQRQGTLCLVNVAKEVGLSMHLLGITSFIPFLKDVPAALGGLADVATGKEGSETLVSKVPAPGFEAGDGVSDVSSGRTIVPVRRRPIPGLENARVLVIAPHKGRFTRVLRLRFKGLNGDYHLLHDSNEALQRYDDMKPDLVVVDNRCDPKGEFVSWLKMDRERSLTSVVKIYQKETDFAEEVDFKIWENDYLVEPFEVLELFTLTEAELTRLPKDRRVFHQQVHFELKTTRPNVDKAYKLSDVIVRQSVTLQDDATALYAAVKEGIDNAAQHGNRFDPEKTIDINFLVDKKKITVIIEDQGEGFEYDYYVSRLQDQETFERAKRRIQEENTRGGLGILLMYKCTDRLEYSGAGNALRLEKNL